VFGVADGVFQGLYFRMQLSLCILIL